MLLNRLKKHHTTSHHNLTARLQQPTATELTFKSQNELDRPIEQNSCEYRSFSADKLKSGSVTLGEVADRAVSWGRRAGRGHRNWFLKV